MQISPARLRDRERSPDFIRSSSDAPPNSFRNRIRRFHVVASQLSVPQHIKTAWQSSCLILASERHEADEREFMNSVVRIVKQRTNDGLKSLPDAQGEKTDREREREVVATVKGWIAELELRRLSRASVALPPVRW